MSLVEQLKWDSDFFRLPIGRVRSGASASDIADAVREADKGKLRCVYLCVAAADDRLLAEAQRLGFLVRDIRVTLEGPLPSVAPESNRVEPAGPSAFDGLAAIARERFQTTRFFADPRFDRDRCRELYAAWLRRGLEPSADRITLIAENNQGFVVCRFNRLAQRGEIELIGVTEDAEGQGIGDALICGAKARFARERLVFISAVTQGRNVAAQRFYERHGLRTQEVALWLHRWVDAGHAGTSMEVGCRREQ